jgi:tRNA (guanine37-N1)-methyltransferase
VLSGVPEILFSPLNESILKRAQDRGIIHVHIHHLRDFATDKHQKIDDYPYGGGAGMVLKPEPIFRCVEYIRHTFDIHHTVPLTLMSAAGSPFTQKVATEMSFRSTLFLLCGHYKGIDQRVIDNLVDEEISIGDYVLTGGELAASVIIDAVTRLLPGTLNDIDSADTDSFQTGILDHPHYTRPAEFRGMSIPDILRSGNHAAIEKWRHEQAIKITQTRRKDLYDKYKE